MTREYPARALARVAAWQYLSAMLLFVFLTAKGIAPWAGIVWALQASLIMSLVYFLLDRVWNLVPWGLR